MGECDNMLALELGTVTQASIQKLGNKCVDMCGHVYPFLLLLSLCLLTFHSF